MRLLNTQELVDINGAGIPSAHDMVHNSAYFGVVAMMSRMIGVKELFTVAAVTQAYPALIVGAGFGLGYTWLKGGIDTFV